MNPNKVGFNFFGSEIIVVGQAAFSCSFIFTVRVSHIRVTACILISICINCKISSRSESNSPIAIVVVSNTRRIINIEFLLLIETEDKGIRVVCSVTSSSRPLVIRKTSESVPELDIFDERNSRPLAVAYPVERLLIKPIASGSV